MRGGAVIAGWLLGLIWGVVWWQFASALHSDLRAEMEAQVRLIVDGNDDPATIWSSQTSRRPDSTEVAAVRLRVSVAKATPQIRRLAVFDVA